MGKSTWSYFNLCFPFCSSKLISVCLSSFLVQLVEHRTSFLWKKGRMALVGLLLKDTVMYEEAYFSPSLFMSVVLANTSWSLVESVSSLMITAWYSNFNVKRENKISIGDW